MPEVDYAILCERARVADGAMFILAGGIDTVRAPAGAATQLGLAVRILFTRNECGRPHRLEAFVQTTDGKQLAKIEAVVNPEYPDGLPAGWPASSVLAINFPVKLPHVGEYAIEILLNDQSAKSLPLRLVEQVAPPG